MVAGFQARLGQGYGRTARRLPHGFAAICSKMGWALVSATILAGLACVYRAAPRPTNRNGAPYPRLDGVLWSRPTELGQTASGTLQLCVRCVSLEFAELRWATRRMLVRSSARSTNLLFHNVLCGFWPLQQGQKPCVFCTQLKTGRGLKRPCLVLCRPFFSGPADFGSAALSR
jgi:hypothetical protein